jgi:hypothetical protein
MNNLEEVKNKIPTFDSEKLCQIIVCDRYLNFNRELAILAMEELSKRRQQGDIFNFESVIEKSLSELPQINIAPLDIKTVLSKVSGWKR